MYPHPVQQFLKNKKNRKKIKNTIKFQGYPVPPHLGDFK
jgi:hypothetical protein